jgi:hypothetical protein
MLGAIGNIAGAIVGGPVGAAVGGALGNALGGAVGGGSSQEAQAFETALSGFAMQIANDSMAEFDEAMADTEEDAA